MAGSVAMATVHRVLVEIGLLNQNKVLLGSRHRNAERVFVALLKDRGSVSLTFGF